MDAVKISTLVHRTNLVFYVIRVGLQVAGRFQLPTGQDGIRLDSNEFYNFHVSALLGHVATGVG